MDRDCATPRFYADLPVIPWQAGFADTSRYARVPGDWCVVVVDIKGSTIAIEHGKYRHVNVVGACAIIAVLNQTNHAPIPYIFGGDGATLLIPASLQFETCCALYGVRDMAKKDFGLDLRAGIIGIDALEAQSAHVYAARKETSPGFVQAALTGAGIMLAEQLVKQDDRYHIDHLYPVADLAAYPVDFSGLECRWQPLASRNGHTLSLIVQARGQKTAATYDAVMDDIAGTCGARADWQPVSETQLKVGLALGTEAKVHTHYSPRHFWKRYLQTFLYTLTGIYCIAFGKKAGSFDGATYRQETAARSDYMKFDSILRLVMDVTPAQAQALAAALDVRLARGEVFYGMHLADSALMTCFVLGYDNNHSHFIDGANGGYAAASRQLKAQTSQAA